MDSHINIFATKVSKGIGMIRRMKAFVSQSTLISVYNSIIFPHFDYCSLVWDIGNVCLLLKSLNTPVDLLSQLCQSTSLSLRLYAFSTGTILIANFFSPYAGFPRFYIFLSFHWSSPLVTGGSDGGLVVVFFRQQRLPSFLT